MGGSNYDMSDWLIRLKNDNTILLSSERKLISNIIIYIYIYIYIYFFFFFFS